MDKKIGQNVAWNTIGSIFYYFCQWVTTVIIVRLGSFELSGYYSLAMTTSASFSAIASFSMRNFQVSDLNNEFFDSEYVGSRIITCLIAQILCMGTTLFVASTKEQWIYISLMMMLRVLEAFVDVLQGIEQKYDRFDLIGISFLIRGCILLVAFSAGLYFTHNLTLTLAIIIGLNIIAIVFYDIRKVKNLARVKPVFNKKIIKLLWVCVPLVIFSFLLNMENTLPKTLLENMYGAEILGIYSSMASPTLIVQVGSSVVFAPFLARIAKLFLDGEYAAFLKVFHFILIGLAVFSILITFGAMIIGQWGLNFLFGSQILEHYELFIPIVWVTIFTAFVWIVSAITIAIREIKCLLIGITVDFIICCIFSYLFIAKMGANGVSFVQILSLVLLVIYMILVIEKSIRKRNIKIFDN